MSTNIKVQRICEYCGNEFTAKTTVTRYCSDICAKRGYKARVREAKIEATNQQTRSIKSRPLEELKAREFLNVRDVSKLIGCSRQNVYLLINSGRLKATNILEKKTIVKRSDLDKMFEQPPPVAPRPETQAETPQYEISDCYNLTEAQAKYGISERGLQLLVFRNSIPKIRRGRFAYIPKAIIDKLLS